MEKNAEENQQPLTLQVRFLHYGPCLFYTWQIPFFKSGKRVLDHAQDGHCLLVPEPLCLVIYPKNLKSVYFPGQGNLQGSNWAILCRVSFQTLLSSNQLWRTLAIISPNPCKSSWLFDFWSFPCIPPQFIIERKITDYYSVFITVFFLTLISMWYGNAQQFAIDLLVCGTRNLGGEKPSKCDNEQQRKWGKQL